MQRFLLALQFLTIFPIRTKSPIDKLLYLVPFLTVTFNPYSKLLFVSLADKSNSKSIIFPLLFNALLGTILYSPYMALLKG